MRLFRILKFFLIFIILVFSFFYCFSVSADDKISVLKINPSSLTVSSYDNFTIDIYCTPSEPIKSFELIISFNPTFLKALSVEEGDFFKGYNTFFNDGKIDNTKGFISSIYGLVLGVGNKSSPGVLCSITFSASIYSGTSAIKFYKVGEWTGVTNETGYLPISTIDGSVKVDGLYAPPSPPSGGGGQTVNNAPFAPVKPIGPVFVELGTEYVYETYSFDIDRDPVKIRFDWGDGNISSWSDFVNSNISINFSHSWDNVSVFPVKAIAEDVNGVSSNWSDVLTVIVSEFPDKIEPYPVINIIGNNTTNETITFDGSSCFDPNKLIISYYWDFGDGENSSGITVFHVYNNSGNYTVTLTVADIYNNVYSTSMDLLIYDSINQILEENKGFSFPVFFIYLFMGIFLVMMFLIFVVYKYDLKDYILKNIRIVFFRISIWFNQKRIVKINDKIKDIHRFIDGRSNSNNYVGLNIHSVNDIVKKSVGLDFEKDLFNYKKHFYKDDLDFNISPSVKFKSKHVFSDINNIVDKLLESKDFDENSLCYSFEIGKKIDDIIGFNKENENI